MSENSCREYNSSEGSFKESFKKELRIFKHRVDLIIPRKDSDTKITIYANSVDSATLVQSWIHQMLDMTHFKTMRYNLVGMEYQLDIESIIDNTSGDGLHPRFVQLRRRMAAGRIDVTVHKGANYGGDINLTFYTSTRDDMSVLAMYLRLGLSGTVSELHTSLKLRGRWEPWVRSVFLREDRADILLGLSPANAAKVAEFAKHLNDMDGTAEGLKEDIEYLPADKAHEADL